MCARVGAGLRAALAGVCGGEVLVVRIVERLGRAVGEIMGLVCGLAGPDQMPSAPAPLGAKR